MPVTPGYQGYQGYSCLWVSIIDKPDNNPVRNNPYRPEAIISDLAN